MQVGVEVWESQFVLVTCKGVLQKKRLGNTDQGNKKTEFVCNSLIIRSKTYHSLGTYWDFLLHSLNNLPKTRKQTFFFLVFTLRLPSGECSEAESSFAATVVLSVLNLFNATETKKKHISRTPCVWRDIVQHLLLWW